METDLPKHNKVTGFSYDQDKCFLGLSGPVVKDQVLDCVLIPVPYDETMSFQTGSKESPAAILRSSYQLEDYDWESGIDLSSYVIATCNAVAIPAESPKKVISGIETVVSRILQDHEVGLVGLIGGEHSISVGGARALTKNKEEVSVLYLDAHADLRDEYLGTKWGHASGARRISEFAQITLGGVRTISQDEIKFAEEKGISISFWDGKKPSNEFIEQLLDNLNGDVYLSLDLDVLDPHLVGNVGNPEPGGMDWVTLMDLLDVLIAQHNLLGFDICELVPSPGSELGSYAAAKIIHRIISRYILSKNIRPSQ